jgi:cytochrome c-type biogenesis protein CcmE
MSRWKVPVVLAVAVAAVGWLVASGVSRNDIYVSTLAQMDMARAKRETVRVMGFVEEGSIAEVPGELVTRFAIRDEKSAHVLPVRYSGVTPGLFREGTSVIASGRLDDDGLFHATELMTKCPSKYEGVETPHAAPEDPPASRPAAAL